MRRRYDDCDIAIAKQILKNENGEIKEISLKFKDLKDSYDKDYISSEIGVIGTTDGSFIVLELADDSVGCKKANEFLDGIFEDLDINITQSTEEKINKLNSINTGLVIIYDNEKDFENDAWGYLMGYRYIVDLLETDPILLKPFDKDYCLNVLRKREKYEDFFKVSPELRNDFEFVKDAVGIIPRIYCYLENDELKSNVDIYKTAFLAAEERIKEEMVYCTPYEIFEDDELLIEIIKLGYTAQMEIPTKILYEKCNDITFFKKLFNKVPEYEIASVYKEFCGDVVTKDKEILDTILSFDSEKFSCGDVFYGMDETFRKDKEIIKKFLSLDLDEDECLDIFYDMDETFRKDKEILCKFIEKNYLGDDFTFYIADVAEELLEDEKFMREAFLVCKNVTLDMFPENLLKNKEFIIDLVKNGIVISYDDIIEHEYYELLENEYVLEMLTDSGKPLEVDDLPEEKLEEQEFCFSMMKLIDEMCIYDIPEKLINNKDFIMTLLENNIIIPEDIEDVCSETINNDLDIMLMKQQKYEEREMEKEYQKIIK